MTHKINADAQTVAGFAREWAAFPQDNMSPWERREVFEQYFAIIDWSVRPRRALDMGCGNGRWAMVAAPLVGELVAADASAEVLEVARNNIRAENVSFVQATPDRLPFPDGYFDLIFSIGVLHHVPDTAAAIRDLASKLSPGGTLLLYLYYAFENRPRWFKAIWKLSDWARRCISRLPFPLRYVISQGIAVCIYWPLARIAKYFPVPDSWPLKSYANRSFQLLRADALDRFGTRLERRFTKDEIRSMLEAAGFSQIQFSDSPPHWTCKAIKP